MTIRDCIIPKLTTAAFIAAKVDEISRAAICSKMFKFSERSECKTEVSQIKE